MPEFTIYIGNKNYSSWSLRAWLMLKQTRGNPAPLPSRQGTGARP
jgi:hypothetical protein